MEHVKLTRQQERWLRTRPVEERQHIRDLLATGDYALVEGNEAGSFIIVEAESEDDKR